jgi:hypothetical protein
MEGRDSTPTKDSGNCIQYCTNLEEVWNPNYFIWDRSNIYHLYGIKGNVAWKFDVCMSGSFSTPSDDLTRGLNTLETLLNP